jgi:hypothetical protein
MSAVDDGVSGRASWPLQRASTPPSGFGASDSASLHAQTHQTIWELWRDVPRIRPDRGWDCHRDHYGGGLSWHAAEIHLCQPDTIARGKRHCIGSSGRSEGWALGSTKGTWQRCPHAGCHRRPPAFGRDRSPGGQFAARCTGWCYLAPETMTGESGSGNAPQCVSFSVIA